ncbi:MAG: periplasmic heavy metal sensor [Balneolaceae bacterium]|nr:periplasmic heavy metal sensor [Balneolaceae bacterium]
MPELSKKYRWALIGFIVMVLLNIGTLATIWIIRPPHRPAVGLEEQPRRVQRFLERELDLTASQREAFRLLRQEHFRETQSIVKDLAASRRAYFDLLSQPDSAVDAALRDSLLHRIGSGHAQLEASTYRHFREMRNMLDRGQRQKLDRIIEQTIQRRERMRGPMRGPGSGMRRGTG